MDKFLRPVLIRRGADLPLRWSLPVSSMACSHLACWAFFSARQFSQSPISSWSPG